MPPGATTRLDHLLPWGWPGFRGVRSPPGAGGWERTEISSLAYDSRDVMPRALFFCVRGFAQDGHDFAADACARGAAALVVERPLAMSVPEVEVASARDAMAAAAARFFGDPSGGLRLVGITGTNGKTTTAFIVRELLERLGVACGLLGTVKSVVGGRELPVRRTTPEAIDLQGALREMVRAGDEACVMEVSSHALALRRTVGLRFAGAVFTNLTQDHLDFHGDMERYFQAKRLLFVPDGPGCDGGRAEVATINVGDPYGRRLAEELPDALTYAVEGEAPSAGYMARDVRVHGLSAGFRLEGAGESHEVTLTMPGRLNVANALAALTVLHGLGYDMAALVRALREPIAVPGRLEPVEGAAGFSVLIDYAHTPDALARVLENVRELARAGGGRVLCVMGAGGDRDRAKRAPMGAAAARGADVLVVTSDNPRSEDPAEIIAQVMAGAHGAGSGGQVEAQPDRRAAIVRAVALARRGDVVLIAGKGHERGQELAGGRVIPFDDRVVAREALLALAGGRKLAGRGASARAGAAA